MANPWDHGCTSLRYYGAKGWRCLECFTRYFVGEPEADGYVASGNLTDKAEEPQVLHIDGSGCDAS